MLFKFFPTEKNGPWECDTSIYYIYYHWIIIADTLMCNLLSKELI